MSTVRVWDLPTRLFHALLAVSVVALVVTAKVGGNWMNWHLRLGYLVLALLLFRLLWGLVGGHWSRFSQFLYTPSQLWAYLRGHGSPHWSVGHSPTGALSVFALLAVLGAQVVSGLFSDDEIAFFGPLTRFVDGDTVGLATWYHKAVGQWLLLGLVGLHLLAIAYYRWVRHVRLVPAMVHGDKDLSPSLGAVPASADGWHPRLLAALLAAGCAAFTVWLVGLGHP